MIRFLSVIMLAALAMVGTTTRLSADELEIIMVEIEAAPTDDITFGPITVTVDDLTFTEDSGVYSASGTSTISVEDESFVVAFADDGLVIEDDSGSWSLVSLEASVSSDFTMLGLDISIDEDNPLTFFYDSDSGDFSIYGDASLSISTGSDTDSVDFSLGDSDSPGLVINDEGLESFDFGISDSITLADLEIATTGDYLGVSYNFDDDTFEIYGGLSVTFDDQTLSITAGDSSDPGLVMVTNNSNHLELDSLDATVSADFTLYDMEINLGDDGLTFVYNSDDDLYEVYGDIDITVDDQELDCTLGDSDTPGLEIKKGALKSLSIGVATDISIGGFEFILPDDDPLTITYSDSTFTVSGEVELDTLWDVSVTLGDSDTPGLIISGNSWEIDDISIEIDSIDVGFAQVQEVKVSFSESHSDVSVDIELDLYISELGGTLDTEVSVNDGEISEIYVDYEVTGTSEGIEILDTGIDVAKLSVTLENLDQPADLILMGTIGLEFGGQFSLDGETVTLIYIEGEVTISSTGFTMTDAVYVGAYEDDDEWKSVISTGIASMDIDWANGIYFMMGVLELPSDYGILLSSSLFIDDEYIVSASKAEVRVPSSIPLIGGDNLGEVDVDVLIDFNDTSSSFAAGWTKISFIFFSEELGIKYKFHNSDISLIDSGDISDIKDEISDIESSSLFASSFLFATTTDYTEQVYTFEVPEEAKGFALSMDWGLYDLTDTDADPTTVEEMNVIITGPVSISGATIETPLVLHEQAFDSDTGTYSYSADVTNMDDGPVLTLADSSGGLFTSEGYLFTEDGEIQQYELAGGTYTLTLTYPSSYDTTDAQVQFDTPSVRTYYDYDKPTIAIDSLTIDSTNSQTVNSDTYLISGKTLPINLEYFSTSEFSDDATISIFVDTDSEDYDGTVIESQLSYDGDGSGGTISRSVDWTIENIGEDQTDEYYMYALIDNGHQQITYSHYYGPFKVSPSIYGNVYDSIQGDVLEGFRVYLDVNGDLDYDAGVDLAAITNSNGNYIFDNVPEGEATVGVVIPYGYESNTSSLDLITTTYVDGDSIEVDFDINLLDSISGYVYEDTNEDGIFDDDEVGVSGVTLYLDENGNGSYDKGVDLEVVTNADGFWRFYNVDIDSSYTIYILAYPSQLSSTDDAFLVVETDTETIPDDDAKAYNEFSGNDIGVYSGATEEVGDQDYMAYILTYYPEGDDESISSTADPDNDSLTNKIEQLLGTDPNSYNGTPTPGVDYGEADSTDVVLVSFTQVSSNRYIVQLSNDLETWETVESFRATSTEPVVLEIESDLASESVFVRLKIQD
ncbi:SdrD B-like domain-containing protein [Cerasicoccus fimbriatus]|uniref:SdrD B-like domain-containing protein n=1 Tax=Cerasicoccus fimbriatus TaxID=3014554 RepID=UPI0022B3F06B|nr:SdrD B-like domain-containing protein [Cerasicoccus sp. TK19100]